MDFFEHQDKARKNTKVLVVYFVIAVACIIASVYLASVLIFYGTQSQQRAGAPTRELLRWDPKLFLYGTLGTLGVFFGRLIQAALSRQREFLADASSVQFTRNPAGLSGALQKIGGIGSRVASAHAGEASHMFFGNGLGKPFLGVLATHPPLDERIRAVADTLDCPIPPFVEELKQ